MLAGPVGAPRFLVADDTVWLTRDGFDKLMAELAEMKTVRRPECIRAIAEARAHGDLSENAEYDAAKEAQGHLERRIAEREAILSNARLLEKPADDKARVGCVLTLRDVKRGADLQYHLVSEAEADFKAGKISITSPVGRGLLGSGEGDVVEITVPAGTLTYEILSISF